ncbi:MAG: hypothetical protein PVI53_19955 [Desulfobacteraceae bacterium]
MKRTRWKWMEGTVNTDDDHMKLKYEDNPDPIALIAPGEGSTFIVQFLDTNSKQDNWKEMMRYVRREIDFFLVELREENPWAYAIYHCSTAANVYSKVHWGYYPKGYKEEK